MAFEQINGKVIKAPVQPGREILARRGAMLAYTGDVHFSPVHTGSGGMGGMIGRMVSGEHEPMMVAQGNGSVYYGIGGMYVTIIQMDGAAPLVVEADRLVAHDAGLQSSVVAIGQGGMRAALGGMSTGQGLFTTQLNGQGTVAVLSHGGTIALPVQQQYPTMVDPQAYVGHIGHVQADVVTALSWRDAVGKGSGEGIQLKLTGQGTVFVQASEQKV